MILKILTHLSFSLPPRTNLYANLHLIMPSHNMVIAVMFSREKKKSRNWAMASSLKSAFMRTSTQRASYKAHQWVCHIEVKVKSLWKNWKYSPGLHYFEMILRSTMCTRRRWAIAYCRWVKNGCVPPPKRASRFARKSENPDLTLHPPKDGQGFQAPSFST